jgi:hypothetical protein
MKTIEASISVTKLITIKVRAKSLEEGIKKLEQKAMKICTNQNLHHPTVSTIEYTDGSSLDDWADLLQYLDY